MVVNSVVFWLFFLCFLLLYFVVSKSTKLQNAVLLVASYAFYAIAECKMLPLLIIATLFFYYIAHFIAKNNKDNPKLSSWATILAVVVGVGMLVYFKYLNFLIDSFADIVSLVGLHPNVSTLNIIMPLGISFFIFRLIGYVVDVHRETIEASDDLVTFGSFVAFFPTILAGPIDRAGEFLPQLKVSRKVSYDYVSEGARRIVWGMFLKMCVADRLRGYNDAVFGLDYLVNNNLGGTSSVLLAMVLYAMEMYADFAGYSEMAIGVAQIMGIKIRENFLRPFLAQNMAEYWRRWHMSLTTWITDYIYMPLNIAFRNIGVWGTYLATIINLVVIGAWHGARWTYVVFGLYHGILLVFCTMVDKRRRKIEKKHNLKGRWFYRYPRIVLTFFFVSFGLLIFRADSFTHLNEIVYYLFSGFSKPYLDASSLLLGVPCAAIMMFKDFKDENKMNISFLHSSKRWIRLLSFALMIMLIVLVGETNGGTFIYWQF